MKLDYFLASVMHGKCVSVVKFKDEVYCSLRHQINHVMVNPREMEMSGMKSNSIKYHTKENLKKYSGQVFTHISMAQLCYP